MSETDDEAPDLFETIDRDRPDQVRQSLAAGADVDARDLRRLHDGQTPLIHASGLGRSRIVAMLLSSGADVNARSESGWTALMRACNAGHVDCARLLLDAGADPGRRNEEGYTAYGRVPGNNHALLRLLRDRGAPTL